MAEPTTQEEYREVIDACVRKVIDAHPELAQEFWANPVYGRSAEWSVIPLFSLKADHRQAKTEGLTKSLGEALKADLLAAGAHLNPPLTVVVDFDNMETVAAVGGMENYFMGH